MTTSPALTRRRVLRLLGGAVLATVPAARLGNEAAAGRIWCRTDPVIEIDGGIADVYLSSYLELHDTATGPAEIVIAVPVGVSTRLLAVDRGFGGYGYAVTFVEERALKRTKTGNPQIRVKAYVPSSDSSLPLRVDFAPRSSPLAAASAEGLVNTYWITLTTS